MEGDGRRGVGIGGEGKGGEGKGREGRSWEGRGREGSVVESKKILKIDPGMLCAERNVCDTNVLKLGHICKVVWSPTLHCRST